VNRSLLAIASALLVAPALFATGAQACISCEYTPEVVKGSQTSDAPRYYAREHVYAVERSAPAKKRFVAERPVAKAVDTADEAPVAKQAKTEAKNENSSISSAASVASAEPKTDAKAARNESSSISVGEKVAAADPAPAKEVSGKATDCKKFFATVGLTLSVPCE